MKGELTGETVRLGQDGRVLYEQNGVGRPDAAGLSLSPEEALYLVQKGKITVEGCSFDELLVIFAARPGFFRSFLVYRDIRERGYAVQKGPHDFRVFRRGQKPGTGRSQYLVRVLSERDTIDFSCLIAEVGTSANLRKQHLLAVVDDESELTFYEVKLPELPVNREEGPEGAGTPGKAPPSGIRAYFAGISAVVDQGSSGAEAVVPVATPLEPSRLLLPPVETLFLLDSKVLAIDKGGSAVKEEYIARAGTDDHELPEKAEVYADLRRRGYIPRTGYKFGHHFRVYTGKKVHSEMLVHAIARGAALPMSVVSRSVRLAHSVKKKMLFACLHSSGIQYVEFARIKL